MGMQAHSQGMVRPKGESTVTWLSAWPSQFLPMYASWEAHLSLLTGTQVTCSQPVQAQTVGLASGRPLLPPWLCHGVADLLVSLSLRGHEYRDSLGGHSNEALLGFLKCPPLMGLKGVFVGCLESS